VSDYSRTNGSPTQEPAVSAQGCSLPIHRDLLGIDWAETPLSQAVVEQLASAAFMQTAHNLILVGSTGTGKSHLATAIGVAAIHRGKRVRFFNAVDWSIS
jgi:DNA replication protein DnaC